MAFLDDIKDRLGFGAAEDEDEFDEELYGDDFDEYAEEFDEFAAEEDPGYSAFAPISTRSASSGRSRRRPGEGRSRTSHPALVSIDDVRSSTRIPESLNRDPLPPRPERGYGRNTVGRASDFALSGSEIDRGIAPAAPADASAAAPYRAASAPATSGLDVSAQAAAPAVGGEGYDPFHAYETGTGTTHRPTRNISVISPVAYGEVENVARMLRAGDAVVLSLRHTPSQLSKRILDFSFGVASALDATVDCIADKVFAITRASALNDDELTRLRNQGVL